MRAIQEKIEEKLKEIEEKEGVRILYAVESGSRAWGFASPDSDYDVRFIYVRPKEDYLGLFAPKDVIEWQLDAVFDINGWDLKKALRQFAKGNATLLEWSRSPVVYRTTKEWEMAQEASNHYFSEKAAVYHYYGTAKSTYINALSGNAVAYKKYFYALRPLLAAEYIETFHAPPPVLFDDLRILLREDSLKQEIEELLEQKRVSAEKEKHPHMPVIKKFIETNLQRQKEIADALSDDRNRDISRLNRCFLEILEKEKSK